MKTSSCHQVTGMSLVELVIAVALLAIVSTAALQFMRLSETTIFGEQARMTKQQRSEAISAHIYKKFMSRTLIETPVERVYADSDMPDDLQAGTVLAQRLTVNMDRFREFCQAS